jgi:hypothetical protein
VAFGRLPIGRRLPACPTTANQKSSRHATKQECCSTTQAVLSQIGGYHFLSRLHAAKAGRPFLPQARAQHAARLGPLDMIGMCAPAPASVF